MRVFCGRQKNRRCLFDCSDNDFCAMVVNTFWPRAGLFFCEWNLLLAISTNIHSRLEAQDQ